MERMEGLTKRPGYTQIEEYKKRKPEMGRLCEKRFGGNRREVENEREMGKWRRMMDTSDGRRQQRGPVSMPASPRTSVEI